MFRLIGIAVGLAFMYVGVCHAQGTLGNIRTDIEDSSNDDHEHSHDSSHDHHCHDDDEDHDSVLGTLIAAIFFDSSPSYRHSGEVEIIEETYYPESEYRNENFGFAAYPYPLGIPGYLFREPLAIPEGLAPAGYQLDQKLVSVRMSIENGNNFSGLNRFNGTLEAELAYVLGIRTSWNYFYEHLAGNRSDDAVLGNFTPTIRLVGAERLLVRVGLGFWIYSDDRFTDSGVNVHLSADYFPVRPLVFSGLMEGGGIGDTGIFHTRITAGALCKGIEFFGGYDYLQIGSSNLHTPMIGVRLWF